MISSGEIVTYNRHKRKTKLNKKGANQRLLPNEFSLFAHRRALAAMQSKSIAIADGTNSEESNFSNRKRFSNKLDVDPAANSRPRRENNSRTLWGGRGLTMLKLLLSIPPVYTPVHTPISISYLLHNLNDVSADFTFSLHSAVTRAA